MFKEKTKQNDQKKGMHKRVTKKKHKNLPQQFICEG